MDFDRKLELGAILAGGVWSLTTILLFASGKMQPAYAMLAIGTILGTSVTLVRVAGRVPE
jgi:hypothetical protein